MARKRRASDDPELLLTALVPHAPRIRKGAQLNDPLDDLLVPNVADNHIDAAVDRRGSDDGAGSDPGSVGVAGGNPLPEHSPIGGSSIERIIACPGSRALVETIRLTGIEEDDPEYRKDGVQAHALAEHCLNSGQDAAEVMLLDPSFPAVTPQMADAVQVFVDYLKARQRATVGDICVLEIEQQQHRPEIHPLYYGKLDAWLQWTNAAEVVDYKNGVGVIVEPAENPQLMHYAGLKIGQEPTPDYPDDMPIQLTIVQPNAYGAQPVRSWMTTAGFIRHWIRCIMLPAIIRAEANNGPLATGDHCRWCPARLICPAQHQLVAEVASTLPDLAKLLPNENLRRLYERKIAVLAAVKAVEGEIQRRLYAGVSSEELGAKLVEGKVDRAWKPDAPLEAEWGDLRFTEPELKSPAQIEKLGDKGKAFVKQWAHKPPGKPVVAPIDDKREAIKQADITTVFAAYTKGDNDA